MSASKLPVTAMVELLLVELRKFWRAVTSAVSLEVFEVMNFVRSGQEKLPTVVVVAVVEAFEAIVVEAVVVAVELAVKTGPCVELPPNEPPVV